MPTFRNYILPPFSSSQLSWTRCVSLTYRHLSTKLCTNAASEYIVFADVFGMTSAPSRFCDPLRFFPLLDLLTVLCIQDGRPRRLEWKWETDNSATFFRPSSDLLRHTETLPKNEFTNWYPPDLDARCLIKWLHNCVVLYRKHEFWWGTRSVFHVSKSDILRTI